MVDGEEAPPPARAPSTPPAQRAGSSVRRPWVVPVIAIAVAALVLVTVLFATGALRFGGSSSPPPDEIFSQAESTAQAGAAGVSGGPWFPVFGAAVSVPVAILEPATNLTALTALANCTLVWPGGQPANVAVPATGPNAPNGAAAYWTIGLKNASNGLLIEAVSEGVASVVLTATGPSCTQVVGTLVPFSAGLVDSPAVVSAADEVGGSAFLSAHPNATRVWAVVGGLSFSGLSTSPEWIVEYTSCTLPTSITEVGSTFNATVGGTSGAVTMHANGTANCALTAPTGAGLTSRGAGGPAALRKAI